MRFWFSVPFIHRTRIGISVSDREIARAFQAHKDKERMIASGIWLDKLGNDVNIKRYHGEPDDDFSNRIKEAEIQIKAEAFAERWTPFVNWFIVTAISVVVVDLIIWGLFEIVNAF